MSSDRVAAEFGISVADARRALEIHRETGRALDEIVGELRVTARVSPTDSARLAVELGITREEARQALRIHRETGRPLDDILTEMQLVFSTGRAAKIEALPATVGKYEVLSLLGRGGGGVVYRVRNPSLGRIEALKLLKDEGETTLEDRERFQREARVLGQLNHPNIVPVYDVGVIDGRPYYAMECIDGESVADIIKRMGSIPPRAAMIIARDAAKALAAAHDRGIIHRDVKPHNILVSANDPSEEKSDGQSSLALSAGVVTNFRVLLTDFGLARVAGEKSLTMESGTIVGTLMYMSPEQVNAERARVNAKSDVYSLGATLYQMLTGKIPFEGQTILELQVKITCDEPAPIHARKPGISKDIETIVMKCLEKDQDRRYRSARELADDIDHYLRGEVIRARPAGPIDRLYRKARRHAKVLMAATGAMLVTAAALIALLLLPRIREERREIQLLNQELGKKREAERSFQEAMAAGRYDDAIKIGESLFGRKPVVPFLRNPSLLQKPGYQELLRPYRVDLPKAYLHHGRTLTAAGDRSGRTPLAQAYRTAREVSDDATGFEALMLLGAELEAAKDIDGALAMYRLAEARFPATPEMLTRLAGALERKGLLEEAAACWRRVGGSAADHAFVLLHAILPRTGHPLGSGKILAGDIDGDRRAEICHVSPEGVLTIHAWRAGALVLLARVPLRYPCSQWAIAMLNVDHDGEKELVLGAGHPDKKHGRIFVVEWNGGKPEVAAEARTGTFVSSFDAADLNGDGRSELIAGMGYFDRCVLVGQYSDGKLSLGGRAMGSDVDFVAVVGSDLYLHLGPWLKDGWRSHLLSLRDFSRTASGSERIRGHHWLRLSENEWLFSAFREPQEARVAPDLEPGGIYFGSVRNGEIAPSRMILGPWTDGTHGSAPARLVIGNEDYVLAEHLGTMYATSRRSNERREFALPQRLHDLRNADVDGDGEDELIFMANDLLCVWGAGNAEAAIAAAPTRIVGVVGRSAGEDMLAAGLADLAQQMFLEELKRNPSNAHARFGLGQALAAQGRFRDAAAEFERAAGDPQLAVESGLRWMHALQASRDWVGLGRALQFLESSPGLDSFSSDWVAWIRSWALPAARMSPCLSVKEWKRDLPIVCESPFEARVRDGALEAWDNSDVPSSTGVAFFYDGGPLRLRIRARWSVPGWEAGIRLGLAPLSQMSSPARSREYAGPLLEFYYAGAGASDDQVYRRMLWRGVDRVGAQHRHELNPKRETLDPNLWYTLSIEIIPGLDRCFVALSDEQGTPVFDEITWSIPFRFDRGVFVVGAVRESLQTIGSSGKFATCWISSIEMEASTPTTRVLRPDAGSAREVLWLANGSLVSGDVEAARAGYDEALSRAENDKPTSARALLFRALCHLRAGDRVSAAADVRACRALEVAETPHLLAASRALTDEERRFLWQAYQER